MKTKDQIASEIFEECKKNLPQLTNFKSGSVFRLFIEVIASFLEKLYHELDKLSSNRYLQTAKGEFLDLKARELDVFRSPASKTKGWITFYKNTVSDSVTIKKDTIVATKSDIQGNIYRYTVLKDTTLIDGIEYEKVLVEAENEGIKYNVPNGDITELSTPIQGIKLISNMIHDSSDTWIVDFGKDPESDDVLRTRCFSVWQGLSGSNEDAYISWIMSTGYIGDIKIIPNPNDRFGHILILCCGLNNTVLSETQLNAIRSIVDKNKPIATSVEIKSPIEIQLELSVDVKVKKSDSKISTHPNEEQIKKSIQSMIHEYFSKLSIGSDFEPSALIGHIYRVPDIFSINIIEPNNSIQITQTQVVRLKSGYPVISIQYVEEE